MGPARRMRRRGLVAGAAIGSAAARNRNNDQPAAEDSTPAAPAQSDMTQQLEELNQLKNEGILTDEEFQAKKQQILGL